MAQEDRVSTNTDKKKKCVLVAGREDYFSLAGVCVDDDGVGLRVDPEDQAGLVLVLPRDDFYVITHIEELAQLVGIELKRVLRRKRCEKTKRRAFVLLGQTFKSLWFGMMMTVSPTTDKTRPVRLFRSPETTRTVFPLVKVTFFSACTASTVAKSRVSHRISARLERRPAQANLIAARQSPF